MTVNYIVGKVKELLEEGKGPARAAHLTSLFRTLQGRKKSLGHLKRVGRRRDVAFYLATGRVKPRVLELDVRIAGHSCGEVSLGGKKDRLFTPAPAPKTFVKAWGARPKALPWNDESVRTYLDEVALLIAHMKLDEHMIESAFLVELRRTRSHEKPRLLWHQQPVYLGGLPFQFPLPIKGSGRGEPGLALGQAGHADVIARRRGGRLRIFEIKKPGAAEVSHAVAQAVSYAAALRQLLGSARDVYLPMLGYSPEHRIPHIDAVALVHEDDLDDVRRSAAPLQAANGHFDLFVMGYALEDPRKIVITREDLLGEACR